MKFFFSTLLLLSLITLNAQGLYDLGTVQDIEITFEQPNWDALMDAQKAGDEDYILASAVTINGITYDSVGVKYKGNSSYRASNAKNGLHIELDTYKDQDHQGYKDIKLSNGYKDPSFLREVLSYWIIGHYMDAPQSNYATVTINGELIGLYSNSESISKRFVSDRFGSKTNAFVKCNPPDGAGPNSNDYPDLVYLGEDSNNYEDAYEIKSDDGWDDLIKLCDVLENSPESIEQVLDVDRTLWMLALNNVLVNLDSYIGRFKQNYYLYQDDYDRFIPVVWDLNESLGLFPDTGSEFLRDTREKQQMNHLLHETDGDFPLVSQLLASPRYKRMYIAHMQTILDEMLFPRQYETMADTLQATIDQFVQDDPNGFFTYAQFLANMDNDVTSSIGPGVSRAPGITNLLDGRAQYLDGLSDFSLATPHISEPAVSPSLPFLGEDITVTSVMDNVGTAELAYRTTDDGPFTYIPMFDDGEHGDGQAGDGTWGVSIALSSSCVEYYIYAEFGDAGGFSPARAQHEFYSVCAATVSGDVVINEFLASNDTTMADQDGEFDDWIELYNTGSETVDLSGYFLSDDDDEPGAWSFPEGTTIDPDGYLIIWADGDEDQDGLHASFKLSGGGESVIFSDRDTIVLDKVVYSDQEDDVSFGRFPNGTGVFQFMMPTFNAENVSGRGRSGLVINELMASNDNTVADQDGDFDDWIEIYNNSEEAIDLSGYLLSDDAGELGQWAFPEGTSIGPVSYLIIWADDEPEQDGLHATFKLSSGGEILYLSDSDTTLIDVVEFPALDADATYGRFPNGTGPFEIMEPSFSAENMQTTSILQVSPDLVNLQLFPNPVAASLQIQTDLLMTRVEIYTVTGSLVLSEYVQQADQYTVDTETWDAGNYLVRITTDQGVISRVVQKW